MSLRTALRAAAATLHEAGVSTPDLDARVLAAHATGRSTADLIADGGETLEPAAEVRLAAYIARRASGEPVARILGRREFWGMDFDLNEATLVPRPDSETVVEAALAAIDAGAGRSVPLRVVDLGTGSGCLLVALLMELPFAWGVGIDINAAALDAARRNAEANGVGERAAFMVGNWAEALAAGVDVIVANPPYIPRDTIRTLSSDVARHDPREALDGGEDGLEAYRLLLPVVARILADHGIIVMEHGIGLRQPLSELAEQAGLEVRAFQNDLSGIERALVAARRDRPG